MAPLDTKKPRVHLARGSEISRIVLGFYILRTSRPERATPMEDMVFKNPKLLFKTNMEDRITF